MRIGNQLRRTFWLGWGEDGAAGILSRVAWRCACALKKSARVPPRRLAPPACGLPFGAFCSASAARRAARCLGPSTRTLGGRPSEGSGAPHRSQTGPTRTFAPQFGHHIFHFLPSATGVGAAQISSGGAISFVPNADATIIRAQRHGRQPSSQYTPELAWFLLNYNERWNAGWRVNSASTTAT